MRNPNYNSAKRKPTKEELRTHRLELLVAILFLPNPLALIGAAAFGAMLNSPIAALITGIVLYVAQVVLIIKLDKKY